MRRRDRPRSSAKKNKMASEKEFAPFVPLATLVEGKAVNLKPLVRVVGFAGALYSSRHELELCYEGKELRVNVSSLQPFNYHPGEIYQFIGEIKRERIGGDGASGERLRQRGGGGGGGGEKEGRDTFVLRAQLYRLMEGLDIELYHRSQSLRNNNNNINGLLSLVN